MTMFIKFEKNESITTSLQSLLVLIIYLVSSIFEEVNDQPIDTQERIQQERLQQERLQQERLQQQEGSVALSPIIGSPLSFLRILYGVRDQINLTAGSINESRGLAVEIRQGLSIAREQLNDSLVSTLDNESPWVLVYYNPPPIDTTLPIHSQPVSPTRSQIIDILISIFQSVFNGLHNVFNGLQSLFNDFTGDSLFWNLIYSISRQLIPFFVCLMLCAVVVTTICYMFYITMASFPGVSVLLLSYLIKYIVILKKVCFLVLLNTVNNINTSGSGGGNDPEDPDIQIDIKQSPIPDNNNFYINNISSEKDKELPFLALFFLLLLMLLMKLYRKVFKKYKERG